MNPYNTGIGISTLGTTAGGMGSQYRAAVLYGGPNSPFGHWVDELANEPKETNEKYTLPKNPSRPAYLNQELLLLLP